MKHTNKFLTAVVLAALASGAPADSLFSQQTAKDATTVSEKLDRFEVGDIVTVIVRETLNATTSAGTNTKKESDVKADAAAAANPFLVAEQPDGNNILNPGELPNWDIQSENETKNTGDTRRRNTLTTSITCTVVEVFPNGNLKISGDKQVTVNRDDSIVTVSGIIRSKDITAQNTIQSTQVADASVLVKGKGPLWNNQRRGLVTRVLDWFSPF
ncbi:MAG: flagellar basal body L-ring protein FlgH [Candidatus Hydrogenedentes bacterium]|jgi:flagellar L-ring protein precursor FlgH|nr:flagellar basal body L-ring protein FlgH [Candidatus Hydrogenedentota bacterium]